MLDGMLSRLDREDVLPAQPVGFQPFPAQHRVGVIYAPNLSLRRRVRAHASAVLQDATLPQKARARALIARHARQGSTCQSVVCSVPIVQLESFRWLAQCSAVILVKQAPTRLMA
jgi:hypothetical protein